MDVGCRIGHYATAVRAVSGYCGFAARWCVWNCVVPLSGVGLWAASDGAGNEDVLLFAGRDGVRCCPGVK